MLPTAAVAQTALESSTNPYWLNDLGGTSFSVDAGVLIQVPGGHAIAGENGDWTLVNLGSIESQDWGNAIDFQGGVSTITNGSADVTGDIRAVNNGINAVGDLTVYNLGTSIIEAGDHGIIVDSGDLTLDNYGTIRSTVEESGESSAVNVWGGGGTITNREGATIEGIHAGANFSYTDGAEGDIDNYGTITASLGMGANTDNGTITNYATGEISGGTAGVQISTGKVINLGTITGNGYYEDTVLVHGAGVRVNNDATVDNRLDATITGIKTGVAIDWYGTIENAGTIKATGTGGTGIEFGEYAEGRIINSGSIIGGEDGYAIRSLSEYSSELVLLPGSSITGLIEMGSGDSDKLTFSGTTEASLSGFDQYRNFEIGTLEEGAIWTLDGLLSISEFTNQGTLQAGTIDKTFEISGKYVQSETGVLRVVVEADGTSSKLVASEAELAGSVFVDATDGHWSQSTYTILEADILSGEFSGATTNLAFLTPTLGGDGTTVTLKLTRNDVALSDVADTPNQSAVANAVTAGGNAALIEPLESLSAEAAQDAFDALAGSIHSGVAGQGFAQAAQLRGVVIDRARAPSDANSEPVEPVGYSADPIPAAGVAAFSLAAARPETQQFEWWSAGYGGIGKIGSDGNAPVTDWINGGLVAGLDISGEGWRAGLGGSIARAAIEQDNGTADVDSYTALTYASLDAGLLTLRGGASYGVNSIGTARQVVFPGFSEELNASYWGSTGQVFGEIGARLPLAGRASVEPYAGLAYSRITTEAVEETGGNAALNIAASDLALLTTTVGIRAEATLSLSDTLDLTPRLGLAWQGNYGDAPASTSAFSTGPSFTIAGADMEGDTLRVDMGVDLDFADGLGIGLGYNGSIAAAGATHQFSGRLGKAL